MTKGEIFFDLDDSLWKASKSGSTSEMWNRLPRALCMYLPNNTMNVVWENYKGSTDFALLHSILRDLPIEQRRNKDNIPMVQDVMNLMWAYYVRMSPESIRDAVFADTEEVLGILIKSYNLGIVSGNDGTEWYGQRGVGDHKLIQSGLANYFQDPSMKFWGGDVARHRRQDLLLAAHEKAIFDSGEKRVPFIYIADSKGDFDAMISMVRNYEKPIDARFGWLCRGKGAMTNAMDHMIHSHSLSPEVNFDYHDRYGSYQAGSIFNVNMKNEKKHLSIHLAPSLTALINPGGLLM